MATVALGIGLSGASKTSTRAWNPLPSPPKRSFNRTSSRKGRSIVVRADDVDFDAILMKAADEFEKMENKPVAIGYGVAAVLALFFTEWLIHLPGLSFLLGFPAQLLGLLIAPVLAIRYVVDKEDPVADVEELVTKVVGLLPGLKKE